MHTHVMSKEGVLETGILAEENVHHEDFSEALYHSIAAFLLEDFHGKLERALYFFDDTEVNRHYALIFFKIMATRKQRVIMKGAEEEGYIFIPVMFYKPHLLVKCKSPTLISNI